MGIIIPVGYSQITFRWSMPGDPDERNCTIGNGPGSGTQFQIAEDYRDAFITAGGLFDISQMSNAYTYLGLTVTLMDASGPIVHEDTTLAGVGLATFDVLPPNVAVLVKKATVSGGRRNRGRLFMPPAWISEGSVTNQGVIAAASVTTLQTRATATMDRLAASSQEPMVLHSDGGAGTLITNLIVDSLCATQRRRLR